MKNRKTLLACILMLLVCAGTDLFAQEPGVKLLPLDDLSSFRPQAGNWFIVGDVTIDRNTDIHQKAPAPAPETGKKSKKKTPEPPPAPPSPVTFATGKGIILNMNTEEKKDHLVTSWEHGDIELELEVMLPRGSNSGIYLQGRYEVQLLDSWGVKDPRYGDIGGIYRNWEEPNSPKLFMGKAPLFNAAKAPGLWQKMKISFRAPRFNNSGEKIANARFNYVELNGVRIHENVEVPQLTGGPLENTEAASGPLMVQGDHGPVALRNIRYKLMNESDARLSDISYKVFRGNYEFTQDFLTTRPHSTGTTHELTWEVAGIEDGFGVVYNGTIHIPEDGQYTFQMQYSGQAQFSVNGKPVIANGARRSQGFQTLSKGAHPFEIIYFKNVNWMPPQLALFIAGTNTYPKALHAFNSYPPGSNTVAPIHIHAGSEPKLVRAFLDFEGDRSRRLTHTIAVGEPGGIHYIYDLKAGNIACVWRGPFLNATPMWHDRGDGSYRPMGMTQYLFSGPSLAQLTDPQSAFPGVSDESDFKGKGYLVNEKTGRPVFKYIYKGVEVEDKLSPDDENKLFTRELTFKNISAQGFYLKLAEGRTIDTLPDGSFAIDDKQYYIQIISGGKPSVRSQSNGKAELILPVDGSAVKYLVIF